VKYLFPILLLAGCGPIPVQVQSSKQEQSQRQSNEQQQQQSADQQSAHQSESKQGTNSMPVIIICNTVSSPNGHCIAPNEDSPLKQHINRNLKGNTK
jgi:type III secretory pathway component EscV